MDFFHTTIVQPIFNVLMLIYSVVPWRDFGIAVIVLTIIIRIIIYPLVRSQLHQTKMMRKLQPELAKIKERAGGDKQTEAMQQMELYKRYGVNPFKSILVLLIQLPIFIGLFQVIQIIVKTPNDIGKFMYDNFEKIGAISDVIANPAALNHPSLGFINLTHTAFGKGSIDWVLVGLAVISAVTQYYMTKQTMPTGNDKKKFRDIFAEAAAGKEPDPTAMSNAMMGGMMKFMPIMMFFIMISLPGALALYYTASNIIALVQQHHLLSKDTQEMDEIASEVIESKKTTKAATSSAARTKGAKEAKITRIKANDTRKVKRKKK